MQKLEKSVQAPALRVGSILLLTWAWRALLIGSLLLGYAGSRSASSEPSDVPERHAIDPPAACLLRVTVDDGRTCRLETVLAPPDLCRALPSR